MFARVRIGEHEIDALIDAGATHNFLASDEAKKLGITITKDLSTMKAVNTAAQPILGVARGVGINLGDWRGKNELTVDYPMILGMEFFEKTNASEETFCSPVSARSSHKGTRVSRQAMEATVAPCVVTQLAGATKPLKIDFMEEIKLGGASPKAGLESEDTKTGSSQGDCDGYGGGDRVEAQDQNSAEGTIPDNYVDDSIGKQDLRYIEDFDLNIAPFDLNKRPEEVWEAEIQETIAVMLKIYIPKFSSLKES
ncbi:hypothetical protein Tsubulata_028346 [Turnera subulata]|uniref:Aspartic peptidase DDI1-type domain-containing protein n=1 Tax=Turnera subulata TaxID=218843 RepID=A0A9Q0GIA1_9ROSI|nr:hypothetical protein Tsubulata_028346 [Turnera subulata]